MLQFCHVHGDVPCALFLILYFSETVLLPPLLISGTQMVLVSIPCDKNLQLHYCILWHSTSGVIHSCALKGSLPLEWKCMLGGFLHELLSCPLCRCSVMAGPRDSVQRPAAARKLPGPSWHSLVHIATVHSHIMWAGSRASFKDMMGANRHSSKGI